VSEAHEYLSRELTAWAEKRGLVQKPTLYGELILSVPLVHCPKWADIRITSVPDEAEVWIDGKNTGQKTPYTHKVDVGAARELTLEIELRKQGYQEVARQVTLRSGASTRVTLELKEVSRSLPPRPGESYGPWIAKMGTELMYKPEPGGKERWGIGVDVEVHTRFPQQVQVGITDVFGRKYRSADRVGFFVWEPEEDRLKLRFGTWHDRPPPPGSVYVVEVTTPEGFDQATTAPLRDHTPWRLPTITYPVNLGLVEETAPTFTWEAFSADTRLYRIEVTGPPAERKPGTDLIWDLALAPDRLSAVFNKDGSASVAQLTPGNLYAVSVRADEQETPTRTDGREEVDTYGSIRTHQFRIGTRRLR